MSFVEDLAASLRSVKYDDLAARTVETARLTVASSLAAAGVSQFAEPVRIVRDLIESRAGRPESCVWFSGGIRLPQVDATRINHMAADDSMADDSALLNGSHLGSAVTAAALAVAESTGASGSAVLSAIVIGYEAAIRLGRAEGGLRPIRHAHVSGLNAFGCAAATAALLDSDEQAFSHALVLAATGAFGVDRVSTNNARAYQAGIAAAAGVDAALAAHHGYRAATNVMDRYLDLIEFDGTPTGLRLEPADPAAPWEIDRELIIKLRPGPFLYGSAVEAALRVVSDNDLDVDEIRRVTVRGHRFLNESDPDPVAPAGSLIFNVASAMARRSFRWDHFADHGDRTEIRRLAERVRIVPTSREEAPGDWGWAAEVEVELTDGTRHRAAVDLPPGSVICGVEWAEVEAKAHELLGSAGVAADRIDASLRCVRSLDTAPDVTTLVELIR